MAERPEFSPGTVSKILWHFTGGPIWDPKTQKQGSKPRPAADAYDCLCGILKSKELRLGSYREVVKVVFPEKKIVNRRTGKAETKPAESAEIESAPVCCLSDIPAAHLGYHAYRYGKFAVGFHRASAVQHGFNPVFYSLGHTGVVRSIYEGFSELEVVDPGGITTAAEDIERDIAELQDEIDIDISSPLIEIEDAATLLADSVSSARESLRGFIAFVKTFDDDEFATIYCEREWRALRAFSFTHQDLAMVVLPRQAAARHYFDEFISDVAPKLRLPRSIPVVPWEDLVEH
jgi:hypothetical protein